MLQKIHQMFNRSSTRIISSFFFFFLSLQIFSFFWVAGSPDNYQKVEINAEADAYVSSNYPSSNLGDLLTLGVTNAVNETMISYIRFDISEIAVPIESAVLRLTTYTAEWSGDAPQKVTVYGCDNNTWYENTITFWNIPTCVGQILDSHSVNTAQQSLNRWDVASWVRVRTHLNEGKVTFFLKMEPITNDYFSFFSKEGVKNKAVQDLWGSVSPPLLIINDDSSLFTTLADNPTFSLVILLCITGGVFFFIIFLFLRTSPSPSPVLPRKKSSKPPPSIEARNAIIFTSLAKKLFETSIEKPISPVKPEPMDLDTEIVLTPKERRSFFCQIDGQKHPATDSAYECEECSRNVCGSCHESSKVVGIGGCPFCQGRLIRIQ
ncbi:MAG: DNRLRE domain-containing protein [Candidatus Heimdallarchaeota archaeon]|nr:MAG: DNRLRE domain-containing protein [Candidatus Heimdallarchaeota archaeon]